MTSSTLRPIAFVLASSNHGCMLVNRHDYHLVQNGGYGVGHQILNTSSFDQDEVDLAKRLIKSRRENYGDGVMCLDAGANIGVHTIEWAKEMYRWGEVIAIEAQERIFYALAGNISLNNCFNARAIWAALGESVGTIGIPQPNYLQPSSFGSLEMRRHKNNEFIGQVIDYENLNPTKMISVDSLNLKRLDFLKLDIEGMEIEGLRGATESLKTFKPQLLVEKIKSNSGEIEDLLAGLGYKLFSVGINLLCVHASDPVASVISVS